MIEIKDTSYVPPEGIRLGMVYGDIPEQIKDSLYFEEGYGRFLKLESGLSAALSVKDFDDLQVGLENSKIVGFLYQ